jgi:hypothetical protein
MRLLAAALLAPCALVACDDAEPAPIAVGELRGAPIDSAPIGSPPAAPRPIPPAVAAMTGVLPAGATAPSGPGPLALASEAPPADPPRLVDGYREVRFDLLTSFDYEWSPTSGLSTEGADERIPPAVRELAGEKVLIRGYMQPIEFDRDGVRAFLLTNIPGGCCFGMVPRLNEWIEVTLPGDERIDYSYFDPVEIRGPLEIGEAKSGDVVTSLYRMTPDRTEVVPEEQ